MKTLILVCLFLYPLFQLGEPSVFDYLVNQLNTYCCSERDSEVKIRQNNVTEISTLSPCTCSVSCSSQKKCCSKCQTCQNHCGSYISISHCSCHYDCTIHKNCCIDFKNYCSGTGQVSDSDLDRISERLLELDTNNVASFLKLSIQNKNRPCGELDKANLPLFASVNASVWKIESIKFFLALMDNYDPDVLKNELISEDKSKETRDFVNNIFKTNLLAETYHFLFHHKIIFDSMEKFKEYFTLIWFGLYDRDGNPKVKTLGSSGFEHVFMGEVKDGKIGGFHNWISYYWQEAKGSINYLGHLNSISLGNKGIGLSNVFNWSGYKKCYGSLFIGTSPELEMALYTICFLTRQDKKCLMKLSGQRIEIQTFKQLAFRKTYIGSAFPNW